MMEGTQRFVYNKLNGVAEALISAGFVRGIAGAVKRRPIGRAGSSYIDITGIYTGSEEADYDFEVLDVIPTTPLVTLPVFTGKGTGVLDGIAFSLLPAQSFTVELNDLGSILRAASVDVFDNDIVARTAGAVGNTFNVKVDRSSLVFTPQAFALLADLQSTTDSIEGSQFDWDTATLSGDGTIPATAKRVAFGDDQTNVYLQYKTFKGGKIEYHFIPSIKQTVPKGSIVSFVTGGYDVELYDGLVLQETFTGIETLYDFLNKIKTESLLITVDSIVALDRTPGGNDSLEFPLNTDAYVLSNSGSGSQWATGFTTVSISANAPTELVIATCFAATPQDDTTAGLGNELWKVEGSISGVIADRVISGSTIVTTAYDFIIPRKVPVGFSNSLRGQFQYIDTSYVARVDGDPPAPPICPASLTLGINAVDQTITLVYTKRPQANEDCDCSNLPGTVFDPLCLGLPTIPIGGPTVGYQADTVVKLTALYDWQADTIRSNSEYIQYGSFPLFGLAKQDPFIAGPEGVSDLETALPSYLAGQYKSFTKKSLLNVVATFEKTIILIDKLAAGAPRVAAMAAWDASVVELQADVASLLTGGVPDITSQVVPAGEALAAGQLVVIATDTDGVDRAFKAGSRSQAIRYGWVDAAYAPAAATTVKFKGYFTVADVVIGNVCTPVVSSIAIGTPLAYSQNCPGYITVDGTGAAINTPGVPFLSWVKPAPGFAPYEVYSAGPGVDMVGLSLLADRYESRLQHALISGGISPLGKSDPNNGGGDGCWEEIEGSYYWLVTGSAGGGYAPAFTNTPYISSKYQAGQVSNGNSTPQSAGFFSTKEFAFVLNVTDSCIAALREGDTVTLSIGNAAYPATYQVGDELILEVVAAKNLELSGGNDGDNIQTWNVTGSTEGPMLSYAYDPALPVAYDSLTGLEFLLTPGVIAFDKGDKFEFTVEGGHFRWRKVVDGVAGAWSGSTAITTAVTLFDSGLSYEFVLGASPAFVTADFYGFKALQPYAVSNVKTPGFERWEWGAVNPVSQAFDFGSIKAIDTLAIAYHNLPVATVVTFSGSDAVGPADWTHTVTVQKDLGLAFLPLPDTARYITISFNTGGLGEYGIGWVFAGTYEKFSASADLVLSKKWQTSKASNDFNPAARYKAKGTAGVITWPDGSLRDADLVKLVTMLDYIKENNNQSFIVSPTPDRDEQYVVSADTDNIDITDAFSFQALSGYDRRMSATLPLAPIYFQ